MKVISIKQFKLPVGPLIDDTVQAPNHGQLVSIKGTLTQFVVPGGPQFENCTNCYYNQRDCSAVVCDRGHYAPITLPTKPYTATKD